MIKVINQKSKSDGYNGIESELVGRDIEVGSRVFNIDVGVEDSVVVGNNSIVGLLREEIQRDDNGKVVMVIFGVEEIEVVVVCIGSLFYFDGIVDFMVFELNSWVVGIVVIVVFGESVKGFVVVVFGD